MTLAPVAGPVLIVGLGNPGPRYAANRHNVGYRVVDELARREQVSFRAETAAYEIAEIRLAGQRVHLLKPLTYMNRSGAALIAWSDRYGRELSGREPTQKVAENGADSLVRPIVVCDDLALPLGALRIRARGSDGGQKGLASIIAALGGNCFPRLRLGVTGTEEPIPPEEWADYVLDDFLPAEGEIIDEVVAQAADAVVALLSSDLETAASRYNRRQ